MKYIKKGDQHFFNTYYVLGTSLKKHKTLHNLHNHLRKKMRFKVFFLTTSRATVQQCSKADAFTTIEHNHPTHLDYSARQHFLLPWKRGNPGLFSPPSSTISSHGFSSSRLDYSSQAVPILDRDSCTAHSYCRVDASGKMAWKRHTGTSGKLKNMQEAEFYRGQGF